LAGARAFAKEYCRERKVDEQRTFWMARSALGTWALALKKLGESLPPWTPPPAASSSRSPLLSEFALHLRELHGNPPNTIHKKTRHIRDFIAFLRRRRRLPHQVRLSDIDAYLIHCRKRYARVTAADIGYSIRGFMRFLFASGRIKRDLGPLVAVPLVRRAERPHRALPWNVVQLILRAVDRSTPCGRRDYALLLMMSTYGMGSAEVSRLMLDDIDWRAATIHVVRPKTGVEFLLPLLPAIARALVSYLRHGRPVHAETRHLFVTRRAPHKALASSSTIRRILHVNAQRADVSAPFLGTHVLRHTHACRQMELGASPKMIGDILGHVDPESTSAYLRVSTKRLREVALAVPR
jgi:integrase/recombinase XerD